MQSAAPLTPQVVFETLTAFHRSAALKTAIELNLFTEISKGAKTAQALSQICDASERGTRILCDSLTVMGFLTKANHQYELNDVSAVFLNRDSPAYLGDAAYFL